MSEPSDQNGPSQVVGRLEHFTRNQIQADIDWYQKKKSTQRRLYRGCTSMLVVLGLVVSLLAGVDNPTLRWVGGVAGAGIVVLSSLIAIYRWDSRWQSFAVTQQKLEVLLADWEITMISAMSTHDERRRLEIAVDACRELVVEAGNLVGTETQLYFETVSKISQGHIREVPTVGSD